ncbi:MAG: MATE family efflux transporter [Clostridia bacterium]
MSKKHSTDELLGQLPIGQSITKLAIPAIVAMLIMAMYNFVDTLFIGMLNSDEALAAVSVAFPIMTLMSALGQVMGAGSAAVIGRAFGYGDDDYASKTATTIIFSSILVAIIFMTIGLVFSEQVFTLFGATERVMPYAKQYGSWMFIGAIFSIPNQCFNNIARAETKAVLSATALMTGAITNIILDPIFMFQFDVFGIEIGLGMGLVGASMATTLSQMISFIFLAQFFFRGKSKVRILPTNFKPSKRIYSETVKSGAPIGTTQLLSAIAVSVTNVLSVKFAPDSITGDNFIAAYGVVLKILSIIQFTTIGFLQGYQPIASYSYGAKNKQRFFASYRFTKRLMLAYSIFATIVVQIFSTNIIMAFSSNPKIIEYGARLLVFNNIFCVLTSYCFLIMLTSQATGNGKLGSIIAFSRQGILYIPALILYPTILGFSGIFYAQATADLITFIIAAIAFMKYLKILDKHFVQ